MEWKCCSDDNVAQVKFSVPLPIVSLMMIVSSVFFIFGGVDRELHPMLHFWEWRFHVFLYSGDNCVCVCVRLCVVFSRDSWDSWAL